MSDGSSVNSINITEARGKLFKDDNSYGAAYKPLFSSEIKYSEKQDKVAILATREQVTPVIDPKYQGAIFSMFNANLTK
jgi:hypothetical protein